MFAVSMVVVGLVAAGPVGVSYELQEGSTLTFTRWSNDQPEPVVITVNIRGEFCRLEANAQDRYTLRRVCFRGHNTPTPVTVHGRGWYQARGACTVPERMTLRVEIEGFPQPEDVVIVLDSGEVWFPQGRFPTIIIDLEQAAVSADWYYAMHLIATPKRSVDFSTEDNFAAHTPDGANRLISNGDLLRDTGHIVRTNRELTRNLGIMPPAPDVGLDAVSPCPFCPAADCAGNPDDPDTVGRCVLFSIEYPVWSETLQRWLGHGDLLCECGAVFRTNAELIEAFDPAAATPDVGLDAVQVHPNGTIWFSTEEGFWGRTSSGDMEWISPGDLLSDQGYVVKTNRELLESFAPLVSTDSVGLDAVVVRPNGEIYFSVEVGFMDGCYGPISPGDLLSDAGYVVARNSELIADFHPDDIDDVGLDALDLGPEQRCRAIEPDDNIDGYDGGRRPVDSADASPSE